MARRTRIGRVAGLLSGSPTLANLWEHLAKVNGDREFLSLECPVQLDGRMRHELTLDGMRRLVAACAGALRAPESVPGNVL